MHIFRIRIKGGNVMEEEKLREKINNMALDRIKKGIPLTDAKILAEVRKLEVMMIEPK